MSISECPNEALGQTSCLWVRHTRVPRIPGLGDPDAVGRVRLLVGERLVSGRRQLIVPRATGDGRSANVPS